MDRYIPDLSYADTYGCILDEACDMLSKGQYNELMDIINTVVVTAIMAQSRRIGSDRVKYLSRNLRAAGVGFVNS